MPYRVHSYGGRSSAIALAGKVGFYEHISEGNLSMMNRYPVFIPKLLPKDEYFVSGRRSCKGCGKALAVRMIFKMGGKEVVAGEHARGLASLSSYTHAGIGLTWNELLSSTITSSFADRFLTEPEQGVTGGGRRSEIRKAVIGVDRRIFFKDPLALSELVNVQREVLYICYDSEMYMDELIRRVSPSFSVQGESHPLGKHEIAQLLENKQIPPQVWESGASYLASACASYPLDFMEKIKKGLQVAGTAFISVLTPCPTAWLFKPDLTAHLGALAVSTGFYPLFEVEAGVLHVTTRIAALRPLAEYFKAQQRYVTFPQELLTPMQEVVKEEYQRLCNESGKKAQP